MKDIAKLAIEVEVNTALQDAFSAWIANMQNGCYKQEDMQYYEDVLQDVSHEPANNWSENTLLELSHFLLFRAGFQASNGMQLTDWENESN